MTGPLRPCVDATLAVLAEGLRIAASEGVSEVRIRRAPDVDAAIKSKHVFDPAAANSRAEHEIRRARRTATWRTGRRTRRTSRR